MTINPHPFVLTTAAEHRRAEILAQVDRERLARRAAGESKSRQIQLAVPSLQMVTGLVALVLTVARQS
jgi:hypothetical protein